MDPALCFYLDQQELTPEQEAYAQQFIEARIAAMLSCAAVNEAEAEAHLHAAYRVAGLEPPQVRWFDSPPAFVAAHVPEHERDNQEANLLAMISHSIEGSLPSLESDTPLIRALLTLSFRAANSMELDVWQLLCDSAWEGFPSEWYRWWDVEEDRMDVLKEQIAEQSTQAYRQEKWLAVARLLQEVGEPNDAIHLAAFNELVSGYRLGRKEAWLVRKSIRLEHDEQNRLHSETGKCVEYADGWGFWAWHGVRVPEKVILAPETLARKDWSYEPNVEVRRVMQERMGARFMSVLGGRLVDEGPCGKLYEVLRTSEQAYVTELLMRRPGYQDLAERYVEVQDASTSRRYFLRVPPTIQTAAEAVAWSFGLSVEEYGPAQET